MSSTRSIIAPPPFAENALTVIPPTPVAGVSYRDETAGPASSPDGWPYAERVNSAEWNQLVYQWSSLLSIMDQKGVLGWTDQKDYTQAAIAFGSNGKMYKWLLENGPGTAAGVKDPISNPTYWREFGEQIGSTNSVRGAFLNLKVSCPGTGSVITITADELVVESATGEQVTLRNVSCTASFAVAGAGGLAVGAANSQLASTLYYIHVIWDGTAPKGWITTDVNPAAALPGVFTHRARVSRTFTDATANKFPLNYIQLGRHGQYRVGANVVGLPKLINGISGNPATPSWTAVPLAPYLAPTDEVVYLGLYSSGASVKTIAAPSNAYGAADSATNLPMANISNGSTNANLNNFLMRLVPESANVYYASNATVSSLSAFGWDDSI